MHVMHYKGKSEHFPDLKKSAYVSVYIKQNVIASNSNKIMPNRQFDPTCSLNIATPLPAQFATKKEDV